MNKLSKYEYYRTDLGVLYCGDCEIILQLIKDKIDLILTDPPYGIGNNWSKSRFDRFYKDKNAYDNTKKISKNIFNLIMEKSKNQIIWGGNYFIDFLKPTNSWIVWDKKRNADKTYMSEAEIAWTSYKKCMRIARYQWNGAIKCEQCKKEHPHQKPLKLMLYCLQYARGAQSVCDPYSGSGSTLIAC